MTKCKSCGQDFQWEDVLDTSGHKIVVGQWSDGSPKYKVKPKNHNCHGNSLNAAIGVVEKPPGLEQAQAHTGIQKYLADIVGPAVKEPIDNVHKILLNLESQNTTIINNQMNILNEFRDLNVNIADFLRGLKIKGKVDYKKDDTTPNLEDKINQIQKDVVALSENFVTYGELNKAALEKGGMISASELYKQKQQTEQIKID